MGMVNQMGRFFSNLTDLTQPLHQLLSKKCTLLWGPAQDKSFSNIKMELSKPTILSLYNPQALTKISADAPFYRLGAVLMHKQESSWTPITFAS